MRTLRLAQAAAEAEGLRLKRIVRRAIRRVIFFAIAGVFALFALGVLHVIAYMALERWTQFPPLGRVAAVFGFDFLVALVFALAGQGKLADPVENEALAVRNASLAELRKSVALATLIGPVGRTGLRGIVALVRRLLHR